MCWYCHCPGSTGIDARVQLQIGEVNGERCAAFAEDGGVIDHRWRLYWRSAIVRSSVLPHWSVTLTCRSWSAVNGTVNGPLPVVARLVQLTVASCVVAELFPRWRSCHRADRRIAVGRETRGVQIEHVHGQGTTRARCSRSGRSRSLARSAKR